MAAITTPMAFQVRLSVSSTTAALMRAGLAIGVRLPSYMLMSGSGSVWKVPSSLRLPKLSISVR